MYDTQIHNIDSIKQKFWNWDTKISMISGRLTRYLRALDVSIHKPLRRTVKNFANYCMKQKRINSKVSQKD